MPKKRQNRKSQTRQKNKKGGREGESNDSPEIPDRGVRHQISLASLPGGTKFCTLSFHLTHFTPGMDIVLNYYLNQQSTHSRVHLPESQVDAHISQALALG